MILFHVRAFDFDDLEVRSRAWLPVCFLRRANLSAKVVSGDVSSDLMEEVKCLILTGGVSDQSVTLAVRARRAGVPVILDIGHRDILNAALVDEDARSWLGRVMALASAVTTSNAGLAVRVEALGAGPAIVTPDPLEVDDFLLAGLCNYPSATLRLIAKWLKRAATDAFAGIRRKRQGAVDAKRIAWFGAARAANDEGGIGELLLAAGDLADLAEAVPVRLDIVGRSGRQARRLLKQLPVPVSFHHYTPWRVRGLVSHADLCVFAGGDGSDNLVQSPARAALALSLNVPVVTATSPRPWVQAMRSALSGRAAAHQELSAQPDPHDHSSDAVFGAWQKAFQMAEAAAARPVGTRSIVIRPEQRVRVLFLLQQFQDIDLIVPVAEAASACADLDVRVVVVSKIAVPVSRRLQSISGNGGRVEFWLAADLLENRIDTARVAADVAMTASEGRASGARLANAFVAASGKAGATCMTLQHGLDNAGLTYGPPIRPPNELKSDLVLIWGGPQRLTNAACAEVRKKVVPVGCPKRVFDGGAFAEFPLADRKTIAVFENLHWRRYDDSYRTRFVRDLVDTVIAAPDFTFVLKPHMGGRWFTRQQGNGRALPDNLVMADPAAATWRRFTADAYLAHAAAVITTPSTIAFDAARYGLPTAVVTYGISAENYEPILRLDLAEDWLAFVEQIRTGAYDRGRLRAFRNAAAIPGDAVARILTVIRMAGAKQAHGDILAALQASGATADASLSGSQDQSLVY